MEEVLLVVTGVFASWVSGELVVSWRYALVDVGQVVVAGMLASVAASRWRAVSRPRARG